MKKFLVILLALGCLKNSLNLKNALKDDKEKISEKTEKEVENKEDKFALIISNYYSLLGKIVIAKKEINKFEKKNDLNLENKNYNLILLKDKKIQDKLTLLGLRKIKIKNKYYNILFEGGDIKNIIKIKPYKKDDYTDQEKFELSKGYIEVKRNFNKWHNDSIKWYKYEKNYCKKEKEIFNSLKKDLEKEGFKVDTSFNEEFDQIEKNIQDFKESAFSTKLLYYSGHGGINNGKVINTTKREFFHVPGKNIKVPHAVDIKNCQKLYRILNKCSDKTIELYEKTESSRNEEANAEGIVFSNRKDKKSAPHDFIYLKAVTYGHKALGTNFTRAVNMYLIELLKRAKDKDCTTESLNDILESIEECYISNLYDEIEIREKEIEGEKNEDRINELKNEILDIEKIKMVANEITLELKPYIYGQNMIMNEEKASGFVTTAIKLDIKFQDGDEEVVSLSDPAIEEYNFQSDGKQNCVISSEEAENHYEEISNEQETIIVNSINELSNQDKAEEGSTDWLFD